MNFDDPRKDGSGMSLFELAQSDINAGRSCKALQLLVKSDSNHQMATKLVLTEDCVDAVWLPHASETPDRFVALLNCGRSVHIYYHNGLPWKQIQLHGNRAAQPAWRLRKQPGPEP